MPALKPVTINTGTYRDYRGTAVPAFAAGRYLVTLDRHPPGFGPFLYLKRELT